MFAVFGVFHSKNSRPDVAALLLFILWIDFTGLCNTNPDGIKMVS
jgi:hypothetical protein